MVEAQATRAALPLYGQVRLDQMDSRAELRALELVRTGVDFGAALGQAGNEDQISRLCEGIAQELFAGTAREGLVLRKLTAGRTASGRIHDVFGDDLRIVTDLGVRALLPICGVRAVHQHIVSVPLATGDDMNGFAVDHLPNRRRVAHGLLSAITAPDRALFNQGIWLTTGTCDDHSCARRDHARIEKWANQLGKQPAGPIHEHLADLFASERAAWELALAAAKEGNEAFDRAGIDPLSFLKYYFPECLIIDALPYGPPSRLGAASGNEHYPGDDEAVVEAIREARRYGIARCRLGQLAQDEDVEVSVIPELIERFGEEPELLSPQVLERVVGWKKAKDAGVGPEVRFVRYWRFKHSHHVVRAAQISGPGGDINDVTVWKTIGLDGRLEREMVGLLERAEQSWSRRCTSRVREECEPGMVQAHKAPQREGLLEMILVANAAGVNAHREMEERRLREHERAAD